jgi:hypothetical protein
MRLQTNPAAALPATALAAVSRSSCLWLDFDSNSIERQTMSSLLGEHRYGSRKFRNFFDTEFEMQANLEGRRRMLLHEFMAELGSRWKGRASEDGTAE